MADVIAERRSYVAGSWVAAEKTFAVENPADETVVAELGVTPIAEVDHAIAEARRSFDEGVWADRPPAARAQIMTAFLDALEVQREVLVSTLQAEAGQPRYFAETSQFVSSLAMARATVNLYLSLPEEEHNPVPIDDATRGRVIISLRRYEAVGVVVAITPYNAALIMALQKIVPALLVGNSVVLRPSPLTPLSSLALGTAAEVAGIPAGVFSVVVEAGAEGATLLTVDPRVDMVSFTGSTTVGRQILAQAASTVKRVSLELGGKSAQIYLPDAVAQVGMGAMAVVAMTSGQACVAATRMLVPHENKNEVLATVTATFGMIKVGSPDDPSNLMGPVINAAARDRCERYVALAEDHGAKVVMGGHRPPALARGYYFEPTVLDVPDGSNPAAVDEIFGPVLTVIGYGDVDEAVQIANNSIYGLSGQVFGADVAAATAIARRIRSGAVQVNAGMYSAYAPSGGYKQSGLGRERGVEGIREFQEIKHLSIAELAR